MSFRFFGDEIRFRIKGFLEKLETIDAFRVVPTRVARLGLRHWKSPKCTGISPKKLVFLGANPTTDTGDRARS
jgi:hypothetical protein